MLRDICDACVKRDEVIPVSGAGFLVFVCLNCFKSEVFRAELALLAGR